ncbi:MAG: hypothetical protein MAG453_01341 [Calditrichaeota bacterium]|nr:hypothetical protein [Calditrichota bacterium]
MKAKKPLDYYLNLKYTVVVSYEDGSFVAWHPEFGKWTTTGVGETPAEAIKELDSVREFVIEDFHRDGLPIPEPAVGGREYSGQFVTRIPSELHRALVLSARLNNVSLNQYIVSLLSERHQSERVQEKLDSLLQRNQQLERRLVELAEHLERDLTPAQSSTRQRVREDS